MRNSKFLMACFIEHQQCSRLVSHHFRYSPRIFILRVRGMIPFNRENIRNPKIDESAFQLVLRQRPHQLLRFPDALNLQAAHPPIWIECERDFNGSMIRFDSTGEHRSQMRLVPLHKVCMQAGWRTAPVEEVKRCFQG